MVGEGEGRERERERGGGEREKGGGEENKRETGRDILFSLLQTLSLHESPFQ